MTLTRFSRSQEGSDSWKMAWLHPISWRNGWLLTKLAQLYCWDMKKNWLDFGDFDPIFKVTQGLRLLENSFSAPCLMNKWMDFDQTCTYIYWCDIKNNWSDFGDLDPIFKVKEGLRLLENGFLIRFWWPWPHFQGQKRAQIVGKWFSAPCLQNEWMDFD